MSSDGTDYKSGGHHLPYWKPGTGHYGKTLGQEGLPVVDGCLELVLSRLDSIPVPRNNGVFTIGDYGTNDGLCSLTVMRNVIAWLRQKHGNELAVQVLYEDQDKNDFTSLFNTIQGESSYVKDFENVYTAVTSTQFYKQVVPDQSCDMIYSGYAVHWLPASAPPLQSSAFEVTAVGKELRPFQKAAAQFWEDWLLMRAKELKPGGLLVILSISAEDNIWEVLRPRTRSELTADFPLFTTHSVCLDLEDSWRELRDTSVITEEEYRASFVNCYTRTERELIVPFEDSASPVRKAGLTLLHHDHVISTCRIKAIWREKLEKEGVDDRQMFADMLTENHRVWSSSSFRSGLSKSRTEDEKDDILDQLYDVYRRRVAEQDPASYRSECYMSRLIIQKKME